MLLRTYFSWYLLVHEFFLLLDFSFFSFLLVSLILSLSSLLFSFEEKVQILFSEPLFSWVILLMFSLSSLFAQFLHFILYSVCRCLLLC
jgi:hypothetical protein